MRKLQIFISIFLFTLSARGQYPYEVHTASSYTIYDNWTEWDKGDRIHETLLVPKFFNNNDSLTIQLTSFGMSTDSAYIRLYRNKKLIHKFFEPCTLYGMYENSKLYVADINGDSLLDIKFIAPLPYNGIAALNKRVVYLFQCPDTGFCKISFTDMFDNINDSTSESRPERDFDNDGNFEIITKTLENYNEHNYWTFNLYVFQNGTLVNVNDKFNYPIMIQYLFKENYKVTDKISKEKMKTFARALPVLFDNIK